MPQCGGTIGQYARGRIAGRAGITGSTGFTGIGATTGGVGIDGNTGVSVGGVSGTYGPTGPGIGFTGITGRSKARVAWAPMVTTSAATRVLSIVFMVSSFYSEFPFRGHSPNFTRRYEPPAQACAPFHANSPPHDAHSSAFANVPPPAQDTTDSPYQAVN